MEKKKTPKTMLVRITKEHKKRLDSIGKGNHRHGLAELMGIYDLINRDPSILLLKEWDHFSDMIKAFTPDNHYDHYIKSNLSAVIRRFITSGNVDDSILNTRLEKPISEFDKEKDKNAKSKPRQTS